MGPLPRLSGHPWCRRPRADRRPAAGHSSTWLRPQDPPRVAMKGAEWAQAAPRRPSLALGTPGPPRPLARGADLCQ